MTKKYFEGFERQDGSVGARNWLAVIPSVFCANEVVAKIAQFSSLCKPILHSNGCGQLRPDLEVVERSLIGLGSNPNVGACLVVSLGCEAASAENICQGIAATGRPVELLVIHQEGGMSRTAQQGQKLVERFSAQLQKQARQKIPLSRLCLGVKCGSSDASSGLAANPATGKAVDLLLENGGTVVFGETTEFIGAEELLASRAVDKQVKARILEIVRRMEERIIAQGVDMRGTQPSRGNIAGGLSTIEEKSLGAISKSGSKTINGVYEFGEQVKGPGLFILDSPGKEDVILTGLSAAGASVIIFTTGGGAPQGCPLVPVMKVASNQEVICAMAEHVDVDVSDILRGESNIEQSGGKIFQHLVSVA
ncbi:MAG: UxaA family hydrolase, partial [Desulfarculaceae bacterium]